MANLLIGLLVVIFPISHISHMPQQIFGIPGVNPVNLIWLLAFILIIFNLPKKPLVTGTSFFKPGFILFLAAFFIAVLWTAMTIGSLKVPPGYPPYTTTSILISNFFKPLQVLLTGWLVYRHSLTHGYKAMENSVMMIPVMMLPFVVYYYFFGQTLDLIHYSDARNNLSSNIGLHANELGGVALIILAYTINRKVDFKLLEYISIIASLLVIAFSLSRMAFLGVVIILLLSLPSLNMRQRITVLMLGALLALTLSPLIISRLEYGIKDSKKMDLNSISANRINFLWKPSLKMISDHPIQGQGYLSIWKGKSSTFKGFRLATHPHNAYLQVALDMGMIGIILLIGFLISFINTAKKRNKALLYSISAWCLMGLTGFSFYPEFATLAIWLLYGISCAKPSKMNKPKTEAISHRHNTIVPL